MQIQPRAELLKTESAFQILARARELESRGRDVVHLEIGQPDFATPANICEAAILALRAGKTGYGPAPGLPELRQAIAEDAGRRRGVQIDPGRVIVTPGAKAIIYYTINAVAGPGDEVIYPDPGFPMYASIIAHSGATGVPLPFLPPPAAAQGRPGKAGGFDAGQFRARLTPRTRLVILNSPHNPTGGILSAEDLAVVAEEARRRDLLVLADEIYINFLYEGEFRSLASLPDMLERTVILDGFSKTYAMTGWRVGYGIVPQRLVETFELYNVNIASCTATFSQYGAVEAIRGPQESVHRMVGEFRRRRDYLVAALNGIPGFHCALPGGAFYAFPDIRGTGFGSADLAARLLDEAGVAVLAGNSFGRAGDGYLRWSYASSLANLEKAVERTRNFIAGGAAPAHAHARALP